MRTKSTIAAALLKVQCLFVSFFLVVASIHSSIVYAQGLDVDIVVPEIAQVQEVIGTIGQPQTIVATVEDNQAVKSVTLFFRFSDAGDFASEQMTQITASRFEATVVPQNKTANLFQYYIQASDTSGNSTFNGSAFSPKIKQLVIGSDSFTTTDQSSESSTTTSESAELATSQPRQTLLANSGGDGGAETGTVRFTSTEP